MNAQLLALFDGTYDDAVAMAETKTGESIAFRRATIGGASFKVTATVTKAVDAKLPYSVVLVMERRDTAARGDTKEPAGRGEEAVPGAQPLRVKEPEE